LISLPTNGLWSAILKNIVSICSHGFHGMTVSIWKTPCGFLQAWTWPSLHLYLLPLCSLTHLQTSPQKPSCHSVAIVLASLSACPGTLWAS
jgi:hypothetical protein